MPDFNFLDTVAERPDPSGRSRTAPPRDALLPPEVPVPAPHPQAEDLPASTAERAASDGAEASSLPSTTDDDRASAFGDTYPPEADIPARASHDVEDVEADADPAILDDAIFDYTDDAAEAPAVAASGSTAHDDFSPEPPVRRSRWPLYVFGAIAFALVALSFIWYVNPYPPLRSAISDFFKRKERVQRIEKPSDTIQPATTADVSTDSSVLAGASVSRDWDFYIQISAWKELATAQREANQLRARQLNVAVEGEYNRNRKGTVFRVRIGPLSTSREAAHLMDSLKGTLPEGAFIDSLRTTGAAPPPVTGPQIMQPTTAPRSLARPKPSSSAPPAKGFAVKVSSYRAQDGARAEADRLVRKGFPAYVVPVTIADAQWYRVLVGPLRTREEAERYARSVRGVSGNEAFVIELSH